MAAEEECQRNLIELLKKKKSNGDCLESLLRWGIVNGYYER